MCLLAMASRFFQQHYLVFIGLQLFKIALVDKLSNIMKGILNEQYRTRISASGTSRCCVAHFRTFHWSGLSQQDLSLTRHGITLRISTVVKDIAIKPKRNHEGATRPLCPMVLLLHSHHRRQIWHYQRLQEPFHQKLNHVLLHLMHCHQVVVGLPKHL